MYGGYYSSPDSYSYMENYPGCDQWGRLLYQEPQYYPDEQIWYESRAGEAQQHPIISQTSLSLQDVLANFIGSTKEADAKHEEQLDEMKACRKRTEEYLSQITNFLNAPVQDQVSSITEKSEQCIHEPLHALIPKTESLPQPIQVVEDILAREPETIVESEVVVVNNCEVDVTKLPDLIENSHTVESHAFVMEIGVAELSRDNVRKIGKSDAIHMELQLTEKKEVEEMLMVESSKAGEKLKEIQETRLQRLEDDHMLSLLAMALNWGLSPIIATHEEIMEVLYANLIPPKLHQSSEPIKSEEQEKNHHVEFGFGLDELEAWTRADCVNFESIETKPDEDHLVLKEVKKLKPSWTVIKCRECMEFHRQSKVAKRMRYPPPFRDRLILQSTW